MAALKNRFLGKVLGGEEDLVLVISYWFLVGCFLVTRFLFYHSSFVQINPLLLL